MCQVANAETATYTYDALGRLVSATYSGGPRDSKQTGLNYDPAGNRTRYSYGGNTTTPTSSMTALNPSDTLSGSTAYSFAPTKFEQNGVGPSIVSFAVPSGGGSASIASGGASVSYTTPAANRGIDACTTGDNKVFTIPVVVRDSSGATVTSTFTVTILGQNGTVTPCY
jgi:hypothetical protein